MRRPTREELIALAKADPEAIADLVLQLLDRVEALEKLETRITELERNSRPLPWKLSAHPLPASWRNL